MKKQDNTIKLLIDKMTMAEKRMFKVYSSAYGNNKNYIELFDAIEKQKIYNETELKHKFKKNFASLKKYLFDSLIDSIKICGDYKDLDSNHIHEIEKYKILRHKGLSNAAEIQLRRTKKITLEDEGYIKHLYALNQEYVSAFIKDTNLETSELKNIIHERKEIFKVILNYSEISDVYFTLRLALKSMYYCKSQSDRKLLNTIILPIKKLKEEHLLSDTAKSLFYMSWNEYYTAVGEYEKALTTSKLFLEINRAKKVNTVELQTILEQASYLLLSLKCFKLVEFNPKLNWLETIMNSSTQDYRFLFCYERWYVIKLRYNQLFENKSNEQKFIETEQTRFKTYSPNFSIKYKAAAFYFNAISYYLNGDYKSALFNCNKIINEVNSNIEEYLYARIVRLLIFDKTDNSNLIEYDARNLIRLIKSEMSIRNNELKIVQYLQKNLTVNDTSFNKWMRANSKDFINDKNFIYYLGSIIKS